MLTVIFSTITPQGKGEIGLRVHGSVYYFFQFSINIQFSPNKKYKRTSKAQLSQKKKKKVNDRVSKEQKTEYEQWAGGAPCVWPWVGLQPLKTDQTLRRKVSCPFRVEHRSALQELGESWPPVPPPHPSTPGSGPPSLQSFGFAFSQRAGFMRVFVSLTVCGHISESTFDCQ